MNCLPVEWLKIDAGRAAVAALWLDGVKQKDISRAFGLRYPARVNMAIAEFVTEYLPPEVPRTQIGDYGKVMLWGDDRKCLVPAALAIYRRRLTQPA